MNAERIQRIRHLHMITGDLRGADKFQADWGTAESGSQQNVSGGKLGLPPDDLRAISFRRPQVDSLWRGLSKAQSLLVDVEKRRAVKRVFVMSNSPDPTLGEEEGGRALQDRLKTVARAVGERMGVIKVLALGQEALGLARQEGGFWDQVLPAGGGPCSLKACPRGEPPPQKCDSLSVTICRR